MYWKATIICGLILISVVSILLALSFMIKWLNIPLTEISWPKLAIDLLTLVTLIVTAVFVMFYWNETRIMKDQMVEQGTQNAKILTEMKRQNDIQMQSSKVSLMPILDVELERINSEGFRIVVHNKGKGPAKVILCIVNVQPGSKPQRRVFASNRDPNLKTETFSRKIGTLGSGESRPIYKGIGISYEFMIIEITVIDLFQQMNKWVFHGEEYGFRLAEFPSLEKFETVSKKEKITKE
jgi:hypothetical protein